MLEGFLQGDEFFLGQCSSSFKLSFFVHQGGQLRLELLCALEEVLAFGLHLAHSGSHLAHVRFVPLLRLLHESG